VLVYKPFTVHGSMFLGTASFRARNVSRGEPHPVIMRNKL